MMGALTAALCRNWGFRFKVLIPEIFMSECDDNATQASRRLGELRSAAALAGVGDPLIGGGWENPSVPAAGPKPTPRPHPDGYMIYSNTTVHCAAAAGCVLATLPGRTTVSEPCLNIRYNARRERRPSGIKAWPRPPRRKPPSRG